MPRRAAEGVPPGRGRGVPLGTLALLVATLPLAAAACRPWTATEPDWLIVAGVRVGPIHGDASAADLAAQYGEAQVRPTRIKLGEGETAPGTVLFPQDSTRRVEILWADSARQREPSRVVLRGSASRWRTRQGISLGTSLEELERLNGRPFALAGFAWDYGGALTSWRSGALEEEVGGLVMLYLDPGRAKHSDPDYSAVLGDREYSSAHPAMRRLNPRVHQILVELR